MHRFCVALPQCSFFCRLHRPPSVFIQLLHPSDKKAAFYMRPFFIAGWQPGICPGLEEKEYDYADSKKGRRYYGQRQRFPGCGAGH